MKWYESVKMKLIGIIGLALAIMFIALGAFIITYAGSNFSNNNEEILKLKTDQRAGEMESFFSKYFTIMEQVAGNKDVVDYASTLQFRSDVKKNEKYPEMMTVIKNAHQMDTDVILSLGIASLKGDRTVTSTEWISDDSFDMKTREWYRAVDLKGNYLPEPYVDAASGEQAVCLSVPIYRNGKVVGIVTGDVRIDSLVKGISSKKLGTLGRYILITRDGTIVGDANSANVMKQFKDVFPDINVDDKGQVKGDEIAIHGKGASKSASAVSLMNGTGWRVMSNLGYKEYTSKYNTIIQVMAGLMIVFFIIGLGVIAFSTEVIVKPLKALSEVTVELAKGNYDVKIEVNPKDKGEIGSLAVAMQGLVESLSEYKLYIEEIVGAIDTLAKEDLRIELKQKYEGNFSQIKISLGNLVSKLGMVIAGIKEMSGQVKIGSGQVAAASQSLSQGSTEQASSIEELTATMAEISDKVKTNSKKANDSTELVKETVEYVETSNLLMENLSTSMKEIKNKSTEINKIIKTIDDIAFQTNILALNAAVEAARAGEAGKGFSVVADEVRNLASKSAEAAKNTTTLIENAINAINDGDKMTQDTASALGFVAKNANEVLQVVHEIAQASEEQATSVLQVNIGLEQVSSVVQNNSATAEQSAAASEELSGQAEEMDQMLSRFKTK